MTARFAAWMSDKNSRNFSAGLTLHSLEWLPVTCLICLPLFMQYNEEIGICHKNTAGLITSIKVKLFIS